MVWLLTLSIAPPLSLFFFFFSLYSVDVLSVWTGTHPKRHATSYSYIIHVSNDELEILTVSLEWKVLVGLSRRSALVVNLITQHIMTGFSLIFVIFFFPNFLFHPTQKETSSRFFYSLHLLFFFFLLIHLVARWWPAVRAVIHRQCGKKVVVCICA